jgi:hypothetical protein
VLARSSGWEPIAYWIDEHALFSVHVWSATPHLLQP